MTRTILTIAAALLAPALFASAAQACISCEYVPEVVNTPTSTKSYLGKGYEKKQKRVAITDKVAKTGLSQKKRIAKSEAAPKKVEIAKVHPAKPEPTKVDPPKIDTAEAAPVETESKPIETASLAEPEATPADVSVGCKKFIPAVGMTVTVPCE